MTPDPLQCLTCGAVVIGGSRFCGQCGADFRRAPAVAAKTVLSAPPRRRDPHRHRNAAWILGGMAAVAVLIVGIAVAVNPASRDSGYSGSGTDTVTVRACLACGGMGKIRSGMGKWTQDRTCRVCSGIGAVEVP